jgi:hypothetical protein
MFTKTQQQIISAVGDRNQPIKSLMIKRAKSSAWQPVNVNKSTRRELIGIITEAFLDGKYVEYEGVKGKTSTAPVAKAKTTVEDVVSALPINPAAAYTLISNDKEAFPAIFRVQGSDLRDTIYDMHASGYTSMSISRYSDGYTHSFRLPKPVLAQTCEIEVSGVDLACWEIVHNDGSGKTVIGSAVLDLPAALKTSKAKLMGISWYPATSDNERAATNGDAMRKIWIVGTHTVEAIQDSLIRTVDIAKSAPVNMLDTEGKTVDLSGFKFARKNGNLFVKFADVSLISHFSDIMTEDIKIGGSNMDVVEFLLGSEFTEFTFAELLPTQADVSSDVDSLFE